MDTAGRRLELPVRHSPVGPITHRVQRRWVLGYLALWAAAVTAGRRGSTRGRARAAGVMLPGGGYLYTGQPGRFGLSVLGVVVGVLLWFVLGMMFLPFAAWALAAELAARHRTRRQPEPNRWWVTVAAGPFLLGGAWAARRFSFIRAGRRAKQKNQQLARHSYVEPSPDYALPGRAELTVDQLTFQRFILDRALQPVDSFDGFLWVDQFRESAVRYQLNYAQWSLALAHYQCTPAFQGYLALAQRRLIEKMTYRKVWQYWRWENLWGNFRYDADPIRRDNIMLSGYYALMLGVYETLSGDQRFNLPGCLEFRLNQRRTFEYDAVSISEAVFANMNRAKYCMFPCDPNWVYSVCNTIGMTALITMDRLHATDHAGELISRFRRAFEDEFISADGRPLVFRSNRMGIAIPGIGASSANELGTVFWLSPVLHDLATRTWLLNRDRIMQGVTQPLIQSPVDKMDLGNYQLTWGPIWYGMAMAAAKEMGDTEAYEVIVSGLECAVERELSSGVDRDDVDRAAPYPATVAANLWMGPGVFGGERAWHDLIIYGLPKEHHDWPMLADAPYPDALVARAVSDGRSLELVLLPGESASQVELGFANLIPGRSYVRHGAEAEGFTAGPDGTASLRIELAGRTELRLVPTQDTTGP